MDDKFLLTYRRTLTDLMDENDKLKQELHEIYQPWAVCLGRNNDLMAENEKLKKELSNEKARVEFFKETTENYKKCYEDLLKKMQIVITNS